MLGLVALAALLRFVFLGQKSFFEGEVASVVIAQLDWAGLLNIVTRQEANMALYYSLLHVWMRLGDSEGIVRILSVIPSVATVPLLYVLGRRLFGVSVGLLAGLLLALNAFHIGFAQTARSYSQVVFLVTLASLLFAQAVERAGGRTWAGYLLASLLAVYSHLFAALVVVAHWVSLALLPRREVPWKGMGVVTALYGISILPLVLFVLNRDVGQIDFIGYPALIDVVRWLYVLAGFSVPALPVISAAWLVALVVSLRAYRQSRASSESWRYGFLWSWFMIPALLAFAVSMAKPIFSTRYLVVCLPAAVLLAAVGLFQLRPGRARALAVAVIVAVLAGAVVSYYRSPEGEDWRGAARYVLAQGRPGDGLLFYAAKVRQPFEYYSRRAGDQANRPEIVFPPTWDLSIMVREPLQAPAPALLERLPAEYPRVWLILSHDTVGRLGRGVVSRSIQDALRRRYATAQERRFPGVRVILYSTPR